MNQLSTGTGRAICQRCLRPLRTCLCDCVVAIASATELLILQHPLEVGHAKGSAGLLHLSLPNSRVIVGETFDEAILHQLLSAPWSHPAAPVAQPVLLYPSDAIGTLHQTVEPKPNTAVRLVVLDGTWRKSRKMLYLNPLLQQLPRLSLSDSMPSRYTIRKAHRPEQLSTLEATCHALAQLESNAEKFRPLLTAFDRFVERQQAYAALHGEHLRAHGE